MWKEEQSLALFEERCRGRWKMRKNEEKYKRWNDLLDKIGLKEVEQNAKIQLRRTGVPDNIVENP